MVRKYECLMFFNPELDEAVLKQEIVGVKTLVSQNGGKVLRETEPKRVTLAYEIKNFKTAVQWIMIYEMNTENIEKLSAGMRLKDAVIRYTHVVESKKNVITDGAVSKATSAVFNREPAEN